MPKNFAYRPVIHLHIPKTGGQTFGDWVQKALPAGVSWFDRGDITAENAHQILADALADGKVFLSAHVFGDAFAGETRFDFLTFVREPIDQIVSNYAHISREPAHVLHAMTRHMSPIEVIQAAPDWFFNHQTRNLVSAFTTRQGLGWLSHDEEWLLENFAAACKRLHWMAPTDELDTFFHLFATETGLVLPPVLESRNRMPDSGGDRWDDLREWLSANSHLYALDLALYSTACRRFEDYYSAHWRSPCASARRFAGEGAQTFVVHASELGRVRLNGGWSVREVLDGNCTVFQSGPGRVSFIDLENVQGRFLSFEVLWVAGIDLDAVLFFDAANGQNLETVVQASENHQLLTVRLPDDTATIRIAMTVPQALPLCIFNQDWRTSKYPVPLASAFWRITREQERFEHDKPDAARL